MIDAARAVLITWFLAHGYQPFQADAMVRQAWTESRLQHCVTSRSGSEGLYQWEGPRRRRLHSIGGPGCVPLQAQLAFADRELRSDPAYRCFWSAPPARAFAVLRQTFGRGGPCP